MANINNKRTIKIFFWHFCNGWAWLGLHCWYSAATALHKNSVVVLLQSGICSTIDRICFVWSMAYWVFHSRCAITFLGVYWVQNYCGWWQSILFRLCAVLLSLPLYLFHSLHFFSTLWIVYVFDVFIWFFFSFVFNGATHATNHAISIIFPINEKLKGRSCSRSQKI